MHPLGGRVGVRVGWIVPIAGDISEAARNGVTRLPTRSRQFCRDSHEAQELYQVTASVLPFNTVLSGSTSTMTLLSATRSVATVLEDLPVSCEAIDQAVHRDFPGELTGTDVGRTWRDHPPRLGALEVLNLYQALAPDPFAGLRGEVVKERGQ
jgi:hypothetical protein